jgi:SAM-dependent methyltransferase
VLDIDPANRAATVTGDLCHPSTLPPEAYDCAIVTQTLQFVNDPGAALGNLWRSLRADGTLLVTVPSLARIDHELPGADLWRFTPAGLRLLIERCCDGGACEIEAGGNLITGVAALLGLAVEDLRESDLAKDAPAFPIIACAAVRKPPPAMGSG